jgi:hypothetical protein
MAEEGLVKESPLDRGVAKLAAVGFVVISVVVAGVLSWPRSPHTEAAVPSPQAALMAAVSTVKATTTTTAPAPVVDHLQPVYAVPSDSQPVAGRQNAIAHETEVVSTFFRDQLGGRRPRFAPDGAPVTVITATLPWTKAAIEADERSGEVIASWLRLEKLVPDTAAPLTYLESRTSIPEQCGLTQWGAIERAGAVLKRPARWILIPMANCDIHPDQGSAWPYGATYLLAHETTHALGAAAENAPHHIDNGHIGDDPRDVIYSGATRDFPQIMVDPGHDDYFDHGRSDLVDIANSDLLTPD